MTYRIIAALLAAALPLGAPGETADVRAIGVDAARSIGTLKPLRGVNGAPDMSFAQPGDERRRMPRPADLSAAYREAAITLVRTHDSAGAADLDPATGPLPPLEGPGMGDRGNSRNVLFPDPNADPDDPRSYNWAATDRLIEGIHGIGADTIFRLGRGGGTTALPPQDLARYASIIRHVVLHYNKGWAGGFRNRVRYWEVWNEPDLGRIWWRGTPDRYYALYAAAAGAVKAADPAAEVGGPTIALVDQPQPYREGFLAYVRDHRLPLDFYSWHYYSDANDPYDFVRLGRDMRALLDRYGFNRTTSVLDEWNASVKSGLRGGDAQRAAFVASSLLYMQDAPIDLEAYYRADGDFGADGRSPDSVGQMLIALGRLARTPERLAASGGDHDGLAVVAGRSPGGDLVQVVVSNYEIPVADRGPRQGPDSFAVPGLFTMALPPRRAVAYARNRGYALTVTGLAPGQSYAVERWRVGGGGAATRTDLGRVSGPVAHLAAPLPPPGVDLIVLRRVA